MQRAHVFTPPTCLQKQKQTKKHNNKKKMTTHSRSSPPDQRTLVDQVKTVVHPYLKESSSLSSPGFDAGQIRNEAKQLGSEGISGDHVSGSSISTFLCDRPPSSPCAVARQVSAYFRNYRPDDDTHLGTTGCSLNYWSRLSFIHVVSALTESCLLTAQVQTVEDK